MNLAGLISLLGDNVDLITKSDKWLESKRISLANSIEILTKEYSAIINAQAAKNILQQKNNVAIENVQKTAEGIIKDVSIDIVTLKKALQQIDDKTRDRLKSEGYEV